MLSDIGSTSRPPHLCDACGLGERQTGHEPPLTLRGCGHEKLDAPSSQSSSPSRLSAPSRPAPLLRCSRCRAGWYHDRKCQKRHHLLHRITCRCTSSSRSLLPSLDLLVRVATRSHGNALVANQDVKAAVSAGDEGSSSSSFSLFLGAVEPLVPPVLLVRFRDSHCAWCLVRTSGDAEAGIGGGAKSTSCCVWSVPNGLYSVWACGHPDCSRSIRESSILRFERDALLRLHESGRDPPAYLAVAILMFRIILAASLPGSSEESNVDQGRSGEVEKERRRGTTLVPGLSWEQHVEVMLARRGPQPVPDGATFLGPEDAATHDNDMSREHERAVIRTVQILCRTVIDLLEEGGEADPSQSFEKTARFLVASRSRPEVLRDLRNRIRINAFGIRSDGGSSEDSEQDIGLGIFPVAHFANHSCRPSARASSNLRPGRLPRLTLEALSTTILRAHEEVTLSYFSDQVLSLPRDERRAQVLDVFGFPCDCDKCRSEE